jgi:hypothetical protein
MRYWSAQSQTFWAATLLPIPQTYLRKSRNVGISLWHSGTTDRGGRSQGFVVTRSIFLVRDPFGPRNSKYKSGTLILMSTQPVFPYPPSVVPQSDSLDEVPPADLLQQSTPKSESDKFSNADDLDTSYQSFAGSREIGVRTCRCSRLRYFNHPSPESH